MPEGKIFSLPGPEDPRRNKPKKSDAPPAGRLLHLPMHGGEEDSADDFTAAAELLQSPGSIELVNFFLRYHPKITHIDHFLRNLKGYTPVESVVSERRGLLRNQPLDALGVILDSSTEENWGKSPDYFTAIVQELMSRIPIEEE
jgi:hypothetical protein